jgi:uncharacterized protein
VKAGRCFLLSVGVLVLFTIARGYGWLGPTVVAACLLTAALALVAWNAGATAADLGLGRADTGSGLRYGAGALGVVLLVLIVAAVIPATNGFLHDSRAQISGGRLLYDIGVSIVLLTAIPEEFALRGVLLGSALKMWVENGRSAVTCQKVMNGIQNMVLSTSRPGGSLIQSGSLKMRCGLHQTIGSDGCCM